jgi:cysteine desulfurase
MALKFPIFMDSQSTTPVDPRVLETMIPYFTEKFGHPASRNHPFGWEAEAGVDKSREQVAKLIGARDPKEVVFTSGGTESMNLAMKGVAEMYREKGTHIVTTAIDQRATLDVSKRLERQGFEVTYVPVGHDGLVDPDEIRKALTPKTILISVMFANNEIGTVQPVAEIGALCRARGILFHTDAAQAFGKIPLDVNAMSIDLLSISGHKVYGPKGVGALYVRRRPRARLTPLMDGGGQERGLRSGTLPTPLIVGLGEAAAVASKDMAEESARLLALREQFLGGIRADVPSVRVNGDLGRRLPANLNLTFPGIGALELMDACPGLALSTGSACTAAEVEPSYVLRALGVSDELARQSLRIGLGRFTSARDVDFAVDALTAATRALQGGTLKSRAGAAI